MLHLIDFKATLRGLTAWGTVRPVCTTHTIDGIGCQPALDSSLTSSRSEDRFGRPMGSVSYMMISAAILEVAAASRQEQVTDTIANMTGVDVVHRNYWCDEVVEEVCMAYGGQFNPDCLSATWHPGCKRRCSSSKPMQ